MTEEMQERDYLALSAVVDAPDSLLRFDNIGDIPNGIFIKLRRLKYVRPTLAGYKARPEGRAALAAYRQQAPAPSAHASEAAADVTTSRALDDLAGDFVRFRMMLAETLGLADIELLDESNEEVCERVATLQTALAAAQERERGLRAALRPFSDVYTRYTAHLAEHGKQSLTFIGFIMRYEENDSFGNLFMEALFTLVSVPAQQPAGAGGGE